MKQRNIAILRSFYTVSLTALFLVQNASPGMSTDLLSEIRAGKQLRKVTKENPRITLDLTEINEVKLKSRKDRTLPDKPLVDPNAPEEEIDFKKRDVSRTEGAPINLHINLKDIIAKLGGLAAVQDNQKNRNRGKKTGSELQFVMEIEKRGEEGKKILKTKTRQIKRHYTAAEVQLRKYFRTQKGVPEETEIPILTKRINSLAEEIKLTRGGLKRVKPNKRQTIAKARLAAQHFEEILELSGKSALDREETKKLARLKERYGVDTLCFQKVAEEELDAKKVVLQRKKDDQVLALQVKIAEATLDALKEGRSSGTLTAWKKEHADKASGLLEETLTHKIEEKRNFITQKENQIKEQKEEITELEAKKKDIRKKMTAFDKRWEKFIAYLPKVGMILSEENVDIKNISAKQLTPYFDALFQDTNMSLMTVEKGVQKLVRMRLKEEALKIRGAHNSSDEEDTYIDTDESNESSELIHLSSSAPVGSGLDKFMTASTSKSLEFPGTDQKKKDGVTAFVTNPPKETTGSPSSWGASFPLIGRFFGDGS